MKSHLIVSSTKDMSEADWLRFRKRGIGASETGKIMGLSEYGSSVEVFYGKIGEGLDYSIENIAMFMGKYDEDKVADLWTYWEGTEESMIRNYRMKKRARTMRRINAYVQNPKWPWLFVSLDRIMNASTSERGEEGTLELKTINGWNADKWVAGIPPEYIIQLQTQMGVCEMTHGELAILKDGRNLEVFPFEFMPHIFENIVETTHEFWQRVEKARSILTQRYEAEKSFNMRAVEDLTAQLHEIEPEPDASRGFEQFLKDKYTIGRAGEREGTILELEAAREHKQLKEQIKTIEAGIREKENYLKNQMKEIESLTFGADGRLNWRNNKLGIRVFDNRVKI